MPYVLAPDKPGAPGTEPFLSGEAHFGAGQTAFFCYTMMQVIFWILNRRGVRLSSRRARICHKKFQILKSCCKLLMVKPYTTNLIWPLAGIRQTRYTVYGILIRLPLLVLVAQEIPTAVYSVACILRILPQYCLHSSIHLYAFVPSCNQLTSSSPKCIAWVYRPCKWVDPTNEWDLIYQ